MSSVLYHRSVILIITGGALLSLLGVGTRLMDSTSSLSIVFYRAIGQAFFLALLLLLMQRPTMIKDFKALGLRGFGVSVCIAMASICIVLAVTHTSVANAVFIISLTPLVAAVLAWFALREIVSKRTIFAIAVALLGVLFIVWDGLNSGGVLGMIFAFMMTVFYASGIVLTRGSNDSLNMLLVIAISGAMLAIVIFPFIDGLAISRKDLLICLGLGVFQVGLGSYFVFSGAKHVPAAQVSVLALLEAVLSPIWVWLAVSEQPSTMSLIGGAILFSGVIYQALEANSDARGLNNNS